jgi:hypothetical protein
MEAGFFIAQAGLKQEAKLDNERQITVTIVQYVPKWLRSRFQKPAPQNVPKLSKKDRQVLPTLPSLKRTSILFKDDQDPAVFLILWRL